MEKTTVYGLPINPQTILEQLKGCSFCVSYGTKDKLGGQLDDAIRLVGTDGILLLDNGAFSHWQRARKAGGGGEMTEAYVEAFETWAADHQAKRPLLFHVEAAERNAQFWLDMELVHLTRAADERLVNSEHAEAWTRHIAA
jgi:hypothetical protein